MGGYVLIVERDPELQRQIARALEDEGFELASEAEPAWAKRSISARPPDVLLVGTALGDGGGFRLAEELRAASSTHATPIVFIASTHRGAAHRAEARRRFAPAEYLKTPLDLGTLVAEVRRMTGAVPSSAAGPATAPARGRDLPPQTTQPPPAPSDPVQRRETREVERTAKELGGARGGDIQGSLASTGFAPLLWQLYAERASGSLLLLGGATPAAAPTTDAPAGAGGGPGNQVKKIVTFLDGRPITVRSNVPSETLGRVLLQKQLITSEQLAVSVRRMQREKRQQGQILLEMGVLSPFNLERALVEQTEAKLLDVFSWSDGRFLFKRGTPEANGGAARIQASPAALIVEGIRRHYGQDRQRSILERLGEGPVAVGRERGLRLDEVAAGPMEHAFVSGINGKRTAGDLLSTAPIPKERARLLLTALTEVGAIEPGATPSGRDRPTSDELALMLEMVRTQDPWWILSVERTSSPVQIDEAYEAKARSFEPALYEDASEQDRRMAAEIYERLGGARRALRSPAGVPTPTSPRRSGSWPRADLPLPRPAEESAPAAGRGQTSRAQASAALSLYETGVGQLRARRYREAAEALRQAARLVPDHPDYRAALGWALYREAPGDARAARAAIAEFRRALQIDRRHRVAARRLAEVYARTGHRDLALKELERLVASDPDAAQVAEIADELIRLRGE